MRELLLIIIILLLLFNYNNIKDNFLNDPVANYQINDLIKHPDSFYPGVKYGDLKNKFNWLDIAVYDDIYNESLKNKLNKSNLNSVFSKYYD